MSKADFERVLGIDLGMASCGWGVIDLCLDKADGKVIAAGVRTFDPPLVEKTGEPKNASRRTARGQRRVIRRRRQRMNAIRQLLHEHALLPDASSNSLAQAMEDTRKDTGSPLTPWDLRKAAHDRILTPKEFAVVLGHIARHRGFRSNSKSETGTNAPDETSKMKKAMETTREKLSKYRSFGEMLATDPEFVIRKRNRDGDYSHTAKRSDLEDEVRSIFKTQRRLGSQAASEDLQERFADKAFFQRPLQSSESMVGFCPFENGEKRAARRSPSFEMFRYLSRLVNLRLTIGMIERSLSEEELVTAAQNFGEQKKITFKTLRKLLDLDPNVRFAGISAEMESRDVTSRTGESAAGTYALRKSLGESPWRSLQREPEKLDSIAAILSFREDFDEIRLGLDEIGLESLIIERLLDDVQSGAFKEFTKAAHISALAARNIIPGLRQGLVYSEACKMVGYDHTSRADVALKDIGSPVARKAFGEALKQIRTLEREYGPFDKVHVELARSVGKSAEERDKMTKGLEKRTAEKEKRRAEASEQLGRPVSDDELLRFELAKEQQFKCIYSGDSIDPAGFAANDLRYQVDHILPWSRFGDDSFLNKTLCTTRSNQDKRGRTPFEWLEKDQEKWLEFVARVETAKEIKGRKKRNYLLKDAASVEDKFKARNLTDTQWASRLLADELTRLFPSRDGKERRIFTRPGAITSKLRRAWGLEKLKKDEDGKRVQDDRHHAVDALVLAATTESLLNRLTREIQQREREGRQDEIFHCAQPWPGFRKDVMRAVLGCNEEPGIFISRAERRRARGKAHDATIKQVREIEGRSVVFERKAVEKLTEKDLDRIPMPEPYGKVVDPMRLRNELVESLRVWIEAKKPKNLPPRSPKGDIIRKVRLETKDKVAVGINGGTADRGDMARVDVFRKKSKKGAWEYYLVPIYPHQIATMDTPPDLAVIGAKNEAEWTKIDNDFEFLWALYPMSYVELVKSNGDVIKGYYRSMDRATASITLSPMLTNAELIRSIGVKTLSSFRKFTIDRLGRKYEIVREVRTWRDEACI